MTCVLKQWLFGVTLIQPLPMTAIEELPMAYSVVAKAYEVPADILYAVAMAESGKIYRGVTRPWPWALNIDGNSIYCQNEQEAIYRLNKAIQQKQAIDIGLMQISWRWHQQRFKNLTEALIPMHNLKAGAAILREQYEQAGNWWQAVGRYHDPGQDQASLNSANRYRERVKQYWRKQFK